MDLEEKLWEVKNDIHKVSERVTTLESADTTEDRVQDDYTEQKRFSTATLLTAVGLTFTLTSIIITILYYTHIIGH
jgi:hypothetical protein